MQFVNKKVPTIKINMKFKKKPQNKNKLNRKELRKLVRKEKKVKRKDYFSKKRILSTDLSTGDSVLKKAHEPTITRAPKTKKPKNRQDNSEVKVPNVKKELSIEELRKKDKKTIQSLGKETAKRRRQHLLKENENEDKLIKQLEKKLNLHKRKSNTMPKSFVMDGLDYILEVCDPKYRKNATFVEEDLYNDDDADIEQDFNLTTGNPHSKKRDIENNKNSEEEDSATDNEEEEDSVTNYEDEEPSDLDRDSEDVEDSGDDLAEFEEQDLHDMSDEEFSEDMSENESDTDDDIEAKNTKRKKHDKELNEPPTKKAKKDIEENNDSDEDAEEQEGEQPEEDNNQSSEVWEDIYGRLRSKDGTVIEKKEDKYIPPALRAAMMTGDQEKVAKLQKQVKGLLNRLAERNLHNISRQIEDLYMNNSRNNMNEALTKLINESIISNVATPERLLMEHASLIAILHANVGNEVGAHFLLSTIKKFDNLMSNNNQPIEDKSLDNVVKVLAQLYNFKVFDCKLLFEILHKLGEAFDEKHIECILHVLRSVGFVLRKEDPAAVKNFILEMQKKAIAVEQEHSKDSRIKFMLDVLTAIKNNNYTKIPNYDTTYSDHLKKLMKGFVRKGNYVTPLNIPLEDLLKADKKGKWWVVGSAWSGNIDNVAKKEASNSKAQISFSQELLDLAKKCRMNTDIRRDIFCIIGSAEDYLDAFEKLLGLGLNKLQERDIIHVILYFCLKEKEYNPFYAILTEKFCKYDRRFQMITTCAIWDKLKILNKQNERQMMNLVKYLTHLFIKDALAITILKVIEFGALDKMTKKLVRRLLIGLLLHNDRDSIRRVFFKTTTASGLKMFRESLRLFIHIYLLRRLKSDNIPTDQRERFEANAKMVEEILTAKDCQLNF